MSTQLTQQDINTRLIALGPADFDALKQVYFYRFMRRNLRSTGVLNIFLGLVTALLGLAALLISPIYFLLVVLGGLGCLAGIWVAFNPIREGFRVFAVLFVLSGLWNLSLVVVRGGQGFSFFAGALGLLQLFWAVQYFNYYQHIPAEADHPSEAYLKLSDDVWKAISRSRAEQDRNTVEFLMRQGRWRGWLLESRSAFATDKGKVVLFADKGDVKITTKAANPSFQTFPADFKINKIVSRGRINESSFNKYVLWQAKVDGD